MREISQSKLTFSGWLKKEAIVLSAIFSAKAVTFNNLLKCEICSRHEDAKFEIPKGFT